MKKLLVIMVLSISTRLSFAQVPNPDFDPELAKRLGGDQRGMKNYVLAILKTGSYNPGDSVVRDSLFKGHFANISRMAEEGKLYVAGPLEKNDHDYRGIFILNTSGFAEAEKLLSADPTISSGLFVVEYYHWYGSAALGEYLDADKKIHRYR